MYTFFHTSCTHRICATVSHKSSCCTWWATPNIKVNYRLATSRFTEHWRIWSHCLTTVRWVILNAADVTARLSRANGVLGKLVYAIKDGLWIGHCHANTQGKESDSKHLHLCSSAPAGEIRTEMLHNSTGFQMKKILLLTWSIRKKIGHEWTEYSSTATQSLTVRGFWYISLPLVVH